MTTFKNDDRVRYSGKEKSLKGLEGTVTRDTVAANGNILVLFDGRDRGTVVNPKNLTAIRKVVPVQKVIAASNPKDAAVIKYGAVRQRRSEVERDYKAACKGLSDLGLIDTKHERKPGKETVYESNAVRLVAETSAPGTLMTPESITEAAYQRGVTPEVVHDILKLALRNKKAATSYSVEVK